MFESSLIALDLKKQRSKRWLSFPLAVALHLIVLVSLGFAQYWNVDKIPEPDGNITPVMVELAPPPMARGERGARPAVKPATAPVPVAPHTPVTAPTVVPDLPVTGPSAPSSGPVVSSSTSSISSIGDGPTQGDPNGVENGDPNGVLTGTGPIGSTANGSSTEAPIFVIGAVVRPVLVDRVEPQYTETARHVRLEGTVIVQAVIDEEGRVVDVKILKPLPMGLDRAAVDAVSRWRFKPATLYGRAVKVYYSLTVNFRVQ
jgi:TonB family protein